MLSSDSLLTSQFVFNTNANQILSGVGIQQASHISLRETFGSFGH